MRKIWQKILAVGGFFATLGPTLVWAAGEKAAPLVIVADTRKLSGIMKWWADLYNESHVYFTILTVILIPIIGLLFGLIADLIMSHIGIDLKSRDLAEH